MGLEIGAPEAEDGGEFVDADKSGWFWIDILAVAIDKRERTRSRGYVEPKIKFECQSGGQLEHFAQTEVMPANAPLINRVGVSSSLDPLLVKSYCGFSRRTARADAPCFELTFFSCSYVVNCTALYGTIRRQLIPFPRIKPAKPSSFHILTRLRQTPLYWPSEPLGCTCLREDFRNSVVRK